VTRDTRNKFPVAPWAWTLAAYLVVTVVLSLISHGPARVTIPYTVFREQVEAGNVAAVRTNGVHLQGTFKHLLRWPFGGAAKSQRSYRAFATVLPPFPDPTLWPLLLKEKVVLTATGSGNPWWTALLISGLPLLLIVGFFVLMARQMRQGQAGLFGFGKSRAKLYSEGRPSVTFVDVAGEDEAKEALRDVIDFLRDPAPFRTLGARIPRGVLLVGPPGTGKTLLARAVAGEAGCTFYHAAATEFVEMFVGVGAARVRDLFQQAKVSPPAIVFLDEIDAVGRRRGAAMGPGNEEREQTLNQLLGELDGFEPTYGLVVLAATNRPDVLDPALLRPGRFDRRVTVGLPDRPGREAILGIHARTVPLGPDVDLAILARSTAGFSGADLANLVNEAAIVAAHRHGVTVTMKDFENAQDRIVMGGLTGMTMSDPERRVVAYHESGHALAAVLLPGADPVRKVSIVPRGRSFGATQQVPLDDRHNYAKEYLVTRLVILLGGRAAEELVFHESTTGAEDDLRQAAILARQMVVRWGMSGDLGLVAPDPSQTSAPVLGAPRDHSDATAARVDQETARLLSDAYNRAAELLRTRRGALDRIAGALMSEEILDLPALTRLVEKEATPVPVGSHAEP
jgi:cell division protease FtsH